MYIKFNILIILASALIAHSAFAQSYEVPPSSSTRGSVSVISDSAMEKCVKLYNEAKWLSNDINTMQVDNYSQSSIDSYNNKVNKHSGMISSFNSGCAGKQSASAYRAAQKLNKR